MDLYQKPVAVALLAHHAHSIRVHNVGIRCEEPQNAFCVPRGEPGAEALEDFKQRGFCLRIRPHGLAILTPF